MSVIIRLQNLSWDASAADIRRFFNGMSIPDGGVHIIGGEKGDAFIAFSTDDDARRAMMMSGQILCNEKAVLMLSSKNEMNQVIAIARGEDPAAAIQAATPVTPTSLPSSTALVAPAGYNPLLSHGGQIPLNALNQIANMTQMNLSHLNPMILQQNQMKQPLLSGYPGQETGYPSHGVHPGLASGDQRMYGGDSKNNVHAHARAHSHGTPEKSNMNAMNMSVQGFQTANNISNQGREFQRQSNSQPAHNASMPSYPPATDSVPRDRWHEGPPRIQGPPPDFPRRPALLGAGPRQIHAQASEANADTRQSLGELRRPLMAKPLLDQSSSTDHHHFHQMSQQRPLMNNRSSDVRGLLDKPVEKPRPLMGQPTRGTPGTSRWSNANDSKLAPLIPPEVAVETARRSSRDDDRRVGGRDDRRGERDRSERRERSRERDRDRRSTDDHVRDRDRSSRRESKERRESRERERDRRDRDRNSDESSKSREKPRDRDRRDREKSRSERDRQSSSEKERDSDRRKDRHNRSGTDDDMSRRNQDTNGDSKKEFNAPPVGLLPHPNMPSHGPQRMMTPFVTNEPTLKRPRDPSFCVFVSNMPLTVSYRNIRRFFHGAEILHDGLKLINDSSGNRCGTAYVKFANLYAMQNGLLKAGNYMDDRQVSIVKCSENEFDEAIDSYVPAKRNRSLSPMQNMTSVPSDLCVSLNGLPPTVDINEIQVLFNGLKFIANSIYIEYGLDGKALGTAYLEFATPDDFRQAVENSHHKLADRVIVVRPMSRKQIENRVKFHKEYLEKQKLEGTGEVVKTDENGADLKPSMTSSDPNDDGSFCCHIFGLSYQSSEEDILQFFSGINIKTGTIKIVRFPDGRAAGDCLIEFASQEDQEEALKRNHQYLGKRFLYINKLPSRADAVRLFHTKSVLAEQKANVPVSGEGQMPPAVGHPPRGPPRDPRRPPGPPYSDEMFSSMPPRLGRPACIVGMTNVHFRCTPTEVIEFFRGYRPIIESLRLRRNPETGKPIGEGTIAFHSPPDAIRAICELNGNILAGRSVSLYQA